MSAMFVFPVIFSFSGKRVIWKVILIFIYIISGLAAYFIYSLGLTINSQIIASFFEASGSEVMNFLGLKLVLSLLGSLVLAGICLYSLKFSRIDEDKNKRITLITVVFTLGCTFGDADWASNIMPHNLIKDSGVYFLEKASVVKKREDLAQIYQHSFDKEEDDLDLSEIIDASTKPGEVGSGKDA